MITTTQKLVSPTLVPPMDSVASPTSRLGDGWDLVPFILLLATFIFLGLTGHDPWKADEAYIFGIIHSMLEDGSWLVPLVAGEPFMEKPPLYAWVAAWLVRGLRGWLAAPDAARITSGLFMTATCWAIASAARNWWGDGNGRYAPILLTACVGLTVQSHMMMPDVPLLTSFSLACWGYSIAQRRSTAGGLLLGLGVGIGFLSKGVLGPAIIGLTSILLPVCFKQWRESRYRNTLVIALITSLPMLLIWPTLLYLHVPDLFSTWFWDNNFGRFLGFSAAGRGTEHPPYFWWQTLPWFTFPVLPIALHALWQWRRQIVTHPGIQCTILLTTVTLVVLLSSACVRAVYALPILAPLAILAVPSARSLPLLVNRLWAGGSLILFVVPAAIIWSGWLIMMRTSAVPHWSWITRHLPADFVPQFDLLDFSVAAAVTAGACYGLRRYNATQSPACGLFSWTIGLTLVWGLLSTLWMPWLDYAKSYTRVFESIPWPHTHGCIASLGLGEGERAMLDYTADRRTYRQEVTARPDCDLLFLQGYVASGAGIIDSTKWELIWSGGRPGDTWQKFWLFRARNL